MLLMLPQTFRSFWIFTIVKVHNKKLQVFFFYCVNPKIYFSFVVHLLCIWLLQTLQSKNGHRQEEYPVFDYDDARFTSLLFLILVLASNWAAWNWSHTVHVVCPVTLACKHLCFAHQRQHNELTEHMSSLLLLFLDHLARWCFGVTGERCD